MGDLDFIGEDSITMRNINCTLQKTEECVSPCEGERDASSDMPERNAARGLGGTDAMNSIEAFERDNELETCESLRHRKRKQETINIHRVSSECAPNKQPLSTQQDKNDVRLQQHLQKPAEDLQACTSPEISRSRKRKRETNKVHEVGLDISLRTDGSRTLQALGFDISVSSSVAVGIRHASCSILPEKDIERAMGARLLVGVVNNNNNKKGESLQNIPKEVRGTTIEASGVSNKDVCSMSTTEKSGRKKLGELERSEPVSFSDNCAQMDELGATMPSNFKDRRHSFARLEKDCTEDQAESQKLRMAVTALHSQFKTLHNLAESGSKDCGHCRLIKEELSKLMSRKASTPMQGLSSEDGLMCSSPVGSCTIERTVLEKETRKERLSSVLHEGKLDSSLLLERDVRPTKGEEPNLPATMNVDNDVQEGSDAECHLCIELGSSQSEDPDAEGIRDVSMEREAPLLTERACNSERLQTCPEENRDCLGNRARHGEVNSEFEKHTNNSHNVEDDRKGEELSAKSSKEEDCWNSAITRDTGDSCVGGIDDQAEKDGYIDLKCGCTSQKYGDTIGILRLYQNGRLEIQCQCSMGCIKGKPMSPASFERHSGRGASKKWRDSIWIVLGDQKVQFSKVKGLDAFVRRYKESGRTMARQQALPKQSLHRDEFLQCKQCLKRRRFRRKTKEECRLFHEASMNVEWECSNYPFESFSSCQDEEEREARQANRGCVRSRTCPGCIECVCLGCFTCRFEDCECRLCTEYIANNK